jgi:hypothetical protein
MDSLPASKRPSRSPDHRCRTDDLAYPDVWAWWLDHQGRVPITMAHGLSQYVKHHGCTFGEAFSALVDRGAIVLIEPEDRRRSP